MADSDPIRPRSQSERRALLVGYSMALEMARHAGPEAARRELEEMVKSEERLGPRIPTTCRHEWVMGRDECVTCGESWASLHPEEELAPAARRGLNRLLASYPDAEVAWLWDQTDRGETPPWRPYSHPPGLTGNGPWTCVDLWRGPLGLSRFAIWNLTGAVYELDEHGAAGDDPVIRVLGEPCAVCGYDNACGDPPGEDCHS